MDAGSDEKGQDKKRIGKRDRENRKARRQVWTREKKRRRLRGKKDDKDDGAR